MGRADPGLTTFSSPPCSLNDRGHVALVAGGWVRDALLGRASPDVDVATSAPSSEVAATFDRVIPMPNDTLIVVLDGVPFEVTPFRTAGGGEAGGDSTPPPPSAAPRLDAEARDFTVNALFYDPLTDRVIDYVGGVADVRARILRGTVDPAARLDEDPLRVLRAVRFAAGLGLTLDDVTEVAVRAAAPSCAPPAVAAERVWKELVKLASCESERPGAFADGVRLAADLGVMAVVLPEAGPGVSARDAALRRLPADTPAVLRVATALPDDAVTTERVAALASRLKLSRKEARALDALAALRALDARAASDAPPACMEWVALYAREGADAAVAAARARLESADTRSAHAAAHATRTTDWAAGIARARAGKLLLTAKAALAAGAPRGKALGDLVRRGEALAVERGLEEAEDVVAALRGEGVWPV